MSLHFLSNPSINASSVKETLNLFYHAKNLRPCVFVLNKKAAVHPEKKIGLWDQPSEVSRDSLTESILDRLVV